MTETALIRCPWPGEDDLYRRYHDEEWGVPLRTEKGQFEFLILEGAQAGLSWLTILRKREHYRQAFTGFDLEKVARFSAAKIEKLLANPGIVRNRLKVAAAVENARRFLEVTEKYGSFSQFIWSFVDNVPIKNAWKRVEEVPATTPLSEKISKEMKRLGFKFCGGTIIYSHMQATGLVNDHLVDCFRYNQI